MEELVRSGRVVDAIAILMAVEWLALALYHRRTTLGPAPTDAIIMLLAGLGLLLALRAALTGANWIWIAVFLFVSLVAHVADLRRRWWS